MFKKLLKFIFKIQELKNIRLRLGEGKLYKLSLLFKPFKEKPRLLGFTISQTIFWCLVLLTIVFYLVHSKSHTMDAVDNGQMALINLESDAVIAGKVITDTLKKEELARQYQEATTKNLEKEETEQKAEAVEMFRAAPLTEENKTKHKIVIIVTDLGLSKSLTLEALQLPKNFTLGFSPYANNVDEWVDQAVSKGFETLINLPMQPIDYPVNDPGPYALLQNLSIGENLSRLDWILSRSKKIIGVYTSPNETFSSSRTNLLPVLENLKKQRKIFAYGNIGNDQSLNSLTSSIAAEYTPIHINIDEELNEGKITSNLLRLEGLANSKGVAVGYINPYPMTIKLVNRWLDDLDKQSAVIVPLSNLFDPITPEDVIADKELERKEREQIANENQKLQSKNEGETQAAHNKKDASEVDDEHASAEANH